jgi:hypothetical protein
VPSKISQSHGFTFGDASSHTNIKTTCGNSNIGGSSAISEDDLTSNPKLVSHLSSYDIKIRRRRACQLKAIIILLAMLAAGFIGCLVGYFFIRYNEQNIRHLQYSQNMVAERNCKFYY